MKMITFLSKWSSHDYLLSRMFPDKHVYEMFDMSLMLVRPTVSIGCARDERSRVKPAIALLGEV